MSYKNYINKLLNERYFAIKEDANKSDAYFSIYLNPTTSNIDDIEKEAKEDPKSGWGFYTMEGGVRYGITKDGDIYAWDAMADYHTLVERFIKKDFAWKVTFDKQSNRLVDYNSNHGELVSKDIPEKVIDRIKLLHPGVEIEFDVW
jgi:hypothetical protein